MAEARPGCKAPHIPATQEYGFAQTRGLRDRSYLTFVGYRLLSARETRGGEMNTTPTAEDRRPLKSRSLRWVQKLAATLAQRGVTPNGISTAGVVFAGCACGLLLASSRGWLPVAVCFFASAVLVQSRLMCNLLDGLVAVEGGKKSKGGDLFNEIPDRIEDTLFLASAG
jgi:hypothetical protein